MAITPLQRTYPLGERCDGMCLNAERGKREVK